MKSKTSTKTITTYIQGAPKEAQKHLRAMYSCIKKSAPGASEALKWSMPAFSYHRILVTFAAFKHHVGLYPTPSAIKAFEKQLSKLKTSAGGIQFPFDKPLPLPLISKIVKFRVKESLNTDRKWIESGSNDKPKGQPKKRGK